jgi:dTDP-4-amino-4,6-dideoxygalactose transaminase
LYGLRLKLDLLEIDRSEFIRQLREKGIGASVHFIPIPLHPYFSAMASLAHNHCPKALEIYPRLVSLPLYPAMTEEQVVYVAGEVRNILSRARKSKSFAVL